MRRAGNTLNPSTSNLVRQPANEEGVALFFSKAIPGTLPGKHDHSTNKGQNNAEVSYRYGIHSRHSTYDDCVRHADESRSPTLNRSLRRPR